MINIKDGYITGWNSPSRKELKELSIIGMDLKDKHGNYLWKWNGEKVIYNPQSLTEKQIEKERTDSIERGIPFTLAQEIALINKGIKDPKDPEYLNYREVVEEIKLKYPKEPK